MKLRKKVAKALLKSDTTNSGNVDYSELARVALKAIGKKFKKKFK